MASLGHIAVGLASGRFWAATEPKHRLRAMVWMSAAAMLPDADVIAFAFGIPYQAPLGHRGAAHALAAAPILAILPSVLLDLISRTKPRLRTWLIMSMVVASHGLLDTLTDGGLGVALAWPWSAERFFAPWRPIPVAPIGAAFISARGLYCIAVELVLFAPFLIYAFRPRRKK